MKIAIFTEGTIIMHASAVGHSRQEVVDQVVEGEQSVKDFSHYVPILIPDKFKFSALLKFKIFRPYLRFVNDLRKKLECIKKKSPYKDKTS
jgi:hypothetical protein